MKEKPFMANRNKILTFFFVIFILFLGMGLRAQETISRNFLFLLDQGRDMIAVKNIVFDHHITLIGPSTSLGGVFQGPFWYYLLALPTFVFGGDPWGSVFLMLVISVAVMIVVYLLITKMYGVVPGVITLLLFAVSPEAAAAATYAWNPHPMWLLIVVYIFIFHNLVNRSIKFNLVLWPIIALMTHFQTALAFFIFLASIIYITIFNKKVIFNKYFLIGLILFFCIFLPQILFEFRHDFLMTKSVLSIFGGSEQGLFVKGENQGYKNLIIDHMQSFYGNFRSGFVVQGYFKYLPDFAIGILIFTLLLASKLRLFSKKEAALILTLTKIILIIFLLSFMYPFPIRYWFLTGFQSFYLILLGLILGKFFMNFFGRAILAIFFICLIINSLYRIDLLYLNPPNDGGAEKIKGKLNAIDFVYKDANGSNFGLLVFTPAVYTDAYDYLTWWHGRKKYDYIPHKEKKGIFYLLMETDSSKPWSNKGWRETVVKTGSILETVTLPSGLIIEKRSI